VSTTAAAQVAARDPRLLSLWRAVHDRLSSGQSVTRVKVGAWTETEREAIADLLGLDRLPVSGASLTVAALERALGAGLRSVVETAVGPVGDRRSSRAAALADRAALWSWLGEHPLVAAEPALQDWVDQLHRAGLVAGSVPQTRSLLEQALAVLAALPADGVGLPVLADKVLHDPHALDDARRLTGVVLQALACLTGVALDHGSDGRRRLWQQAGVETDALSSTVLVAGLRLRGPGPVPLALGAWVDAGEAAVLTLSQLRALTAPSPVGGVVHVVENPSVMAAALARFDLDCPPLVCVSGWPSAAGVLLLRLLRVAGAGLRYHGDLDGDGLRIAAHLVARVGAQPWRMTAADYLAALERRPGGPPAGRVSDVPWDSALGPAMRAGGIAVTEESVLDELLDDIGP